MTSTDPDAIVMRHAIEDSSERDVLRCGPELAARLRLGINYHSPSEFRDLAYFLLDDGAISQALDDGYFTINKYVRIARTRERSLMTLSELSRAVGVPQQTLWRWVRSSRLPYRSEGNKKLYNINDIEQLLLTRREGI